jgi:hypothetical protein
MKKPAVYLIIGITLIFFISFTGCVAPPAEQQIIPVDNYDPNQFASTGTNASNVSIYVTEVTPFVMVTPADAKVTYNSVPMTTAIPKEKSCRIYTKTQTYAYNGSAFTYNLKNPPMLINYTVIPTNVTSKKVITSKIVGQGDQTITIDTYSPNSWLEITIRDKTTGEIYQQDGFGKDHSTYLKNTMKVNKYGDLLIEIKGNLITGTVDFWVKPELNFENPEQVNAAVCTEIEQGRASLAYVTATPVPTWAG